MFAGPEKGLACFPGLLTVGKSHSFQCLPKAAISNNQLMFRPSRAEIQTMSTALLHRLLQRKPPAPTTLRMNVCPPDIYPARASLWSATLRWLVGNDAGVAPALRTPLERARTEFLAAMAGVIDVDTNDLLNRAQHARSLRELWHLRSELYTMIARRVSQKEADVRLARVNQHFPSRAHRTGNLATEAADVQ
jgi:hypothetical protein